MYPCRNPMLRAARSHGVEGKARHGRAAEPSREPSGEAKASEPGQRGQAAERGAAAAALRGTVLHCAATCRAGAATFANPPNEVLRLHAARFLLHVPPSMSPAVSRGAWHSLRSVTLRGKRPPTKIRTSLTKTRSFHCPWEPAPASGVSPSMRLMKARWTMAEWSARMGCRTRPSMERTLRLTAASRGFSAHARRCGRRRSGLRLRRFRAQLRLDLSAAP